MSSPEKAYGEYVFALLHEEQNQVRLRALEREIEQGPKPWLYGRAIAHLPAARDRYEELCLQGGIQPEIWSAWVDLE